MPRTPKLHLIGQRFGRLLVLGNAPRNRHSHRHFLCLCECGTFSEHSAGSLNGGKVHSCGCLKNDLLRERSLTHGHSVNRRMSREYSAWIAMKMRVENPKHKDFSLYGGRGISISEAWAANFEAFYRDMGSCQKGLTLDRIDPNGHYAPGNCRWATWKEQRRNQRNCRPILFNGKSQILTDWAKEIGIPLIVLWKRINRGWPVSIALSKPLRLTGERKGNGG